MKFKRLQNLAVAMLVSTTIVGCNVMQSDIEAPASLKVAMKAESSSTTLLKSGSVALQSGSIEIYEVKMFLDEIELI